MRFKRKRKPGPSKNEKKVQRRDGGGFGTRPVLSQIHPEVSNLTIQIAFTSPQKALIKEETLTFSPEDATAFSCACPGVCDVGTFDFTEKIGDMVAAQELMAETTGTCQVEGLGGIPPTCGYILKAHIEITY